MRIKPHTLLCLMALALLLAQSARADERMFSAHL